MTEESKTRLIASHSGKPLKDSTKEKIRIAMKEREFTEDHRKNLSEAGKKRVTTDSLRDAMREGQKRRWAKARGEIV